MITCSTGNFGIFHITRNSTYSQCPSAVSWVLLRCEESQVHQACLSVQSQATQRETEPGRRETEIIVGLRTLCQPLPCLAEVDFKVSWLSTIHSVFCHDEMTKYEAQTQTLHVCWLSSNKSEMSYVFAKVIGTGEEEHIAYNCLPQASKYLRLVKVLS